jgi:hypothetical protein
MGGGCLVLSRAPHPMPKLASINFWWPAIDSCCVGNGFTTLSDCITLSIEPSFKVLIRETVKLQVCLFIAAQHEAVCSENRSNASTPGAHFDKVVSQYLIRVALVRPRMPGSINLPGTAAPAGLSDLVSS